MKRYARTIFTLFFSSSLVPKFPSRCYCVVHRTAVYGTRFVEYHIHPIALLVARNSFAFAFVPRAIKFHTSPRSPLVFLFFLFSRFVYCSPVHGYFRAFCYQRKTRWLRIDPFDTISFLLCHYVSGRNTGRIRA